MSFDLREWAEGALPRAKSAGRNVVSECPFCGKAQHFGINVERGHDRYGRWQCYKCGEHGRSPAALIAQVEGTSEAEARATIARGALDHRREETPRTLRERMAALRGRSVEQREADYPLPEEFIPVRDGERWQMPVYLSERGIRRETAAAWGMGFCREGLYARRVIVPIVCPAGRSFTARATDGDELRYRNPRGADHGRLLIGWDLAPLDADFTICEGPFDAVALWQMGFPALAIGGNRLREEQLSLLCSRSTAARVTVMLDPQERAEAHHLGILLRAHFGSVRVAQLDGAGPRGQKLDPGCATQAQVRAALAGSVAPSRILALSVRISEGKSVT